MSEYAYAMFDRYGRCLNIMRTVIENDLPYLVPSETKPEDIYLTATDEIKPRIPITITVDRLHFIADGDDEAIVNGLPDDALLLANNEVNGSLSSPVAGSMMLEATGKYRSNMICIVFATIDEIAAKFTTDIDKAAGVARLRFMTDAPGQSAIYAKKEAEARAYLIDPTGEYPFLFAEPGEREAAAQKIIARANACNLALSEIEALRIGAKQAISNATDVATMTEAMKIAWPEE